MIKRTNGRRGRRALSVLVLVGLTAVVVAACGSSGSGGGGGTSASAKQTIKIFYVATSGGEANPIVPVINGFEAKYPNIKVTLSTAPVNTYPQVLATEIQSGNGPDIFHGTIGFGQALSLGKLARAGDTVPFTANWATSLVPANQKSLFTYQGEQFGVPDAFQPVGMIYNYGALQKLGLTPPTSLPELYSDCAKVAATGDSYINLAGSASVNTGVMMTSIEASLVYSVDPGWNAQKSAGKVTFADSSVWQNALQAVVNMKSRGCFQTGVAAGSLEALFPAVATGKSLAMFAPASVTSDLAGIVKNGNFKLGAFPGQTAGQTRIIASASDANAVWSGSSHKAAAMLFLQYMSTPSVLNAYANAEGLTPLSEFISGDYGSSLSLVSPYFKSGKYFPDGSLYWPNASVFSALTTGIQGLLTGQATVKAVLQSMDAAWQGGS